MHSIHKIAIFALHCVRSMSTSEFVILFFQIEIQQSNDSARTRHVSMPPRSALNCRAENSKDRFFLLRSLALACARVVKAEKKLKCKVQHLLRLCGMDRFFSYTFFFLLSFLPFRWMLILQFYSASLVFTIFFFFIALHWKLEVSFTICTLLFSLCFYFSLFFHLRFSSQCRVLTCSQL